LRPILTKEIDLKDFKHYFWLQNELILFCEENNLDKEGKKTEIEERIKNFLMRKVS
jgi:hypothetical protein